MEKIFYQLRGFSLIILSLLLSGPFVFSAKTAQAASEPGVGLHEGQQTRNFRVKTGIDVLEAENFAPLAGLRVGLITNHSGQDSAGQSTVEILRRAPGIKLVAIFSPEHGLSGRMDREVSSGIDPSSGLPVYSLYSGARRPTEKMLEGLDALVFDVQDAGVRFYTYITTMGYAMEAAARKGLSFYVLDRPNPITASFVQGPVMDRDMESFTGYFPLPVRHGMTVGELASLFNSENKIGVNLHVVRMRGYERADWYDNTGLIWVPPSPNLHTLREAVLYPGVAMVEGANVSVGRGTGTPFELVGAPWVQADELAAYLNGRKIQGVRFTPVDFIPESDRYKTKVCHGVSISLEDREILDPTVLGIEIAAALYKLFPGDFQIHKALSLIGSQKVLQAIEEGYDPRTIADNWQKPLEDFISLRSKYLLY